MLDPFLRLSFSCLSDFAFFDTIASSKGVLDGVIDGKFDFTKRSIEGELDIFEDGAVDGFCLGNKIVHNEGRVLGSRDGLTDIEGALDGFIDGIDDSF